MSGRSACGLQTWGAARRRGEIERWAKDVELGRADFRAFPRYPLIMSVLPKSRAEREIIRAQQELRAEMDRAAARHEEALAELTSRVDALAYDSEVEATAAERVRSGADRRTEDGATALRDLGIDVDRHRVG